MSEDPSRITAMEVDTAFIKSKRGILKVAEMVRQIAHHHEVKSFMVGNISKELRYNLHTLNGKQIL